MYIYIYIFVHENDSVAVELNTKSASNIESVQPEINALLENLLHVGRITYNIISALLANDDRVY